MQHIIDWLYHVGGIPGVGPWYGFWSGIGSDLGEVAVLGGLISLYRKHNCHVKGCVRLGRHPVDGTAYITCAKHHPNGAPSHGDVLAAHAAASRK